VNRLRVLKICNKRTATASMILQLPNTAPFESFGIPRKLELPRSLLLRISEALLMARRRRSFFEGVPVHVHQRGNNRAAMFHDVYDRIVFLMALLESSQRYAVAIHSWVLMNNHFHLLATPQDEEGLPRMLQQVGRRYVPHFNKRNDRTGGLWEGRYSAHLVDTETYWYRCARYVELNPVRASMVSAPHEHPWSSYHALAYGAADKLVTPHPLYVALGATPLERQAAHRALCGTSLTDAELASVRNALRTGISGAELPEASALAAAS
jgi:putative transposase